MSRYLRLKHPGATLFLTVNLFDRGSDLLARHIDILRDVARRTKADKPFAIDAWVVLPDHMHCIWTLPEGDADYSNRVGMLKARFSRDLGKLGLVPDRSGDSPTPQVNPFGAVGGRSKERGGSLNVRVGLSPDLVCSSYVIVCPCSRSKRVQGQVCVVPTLGICPARSVTAPALIPVSNG